MLCKLRPPPRCSDLLSSFGSPLPALTPRHRQTFPLNNLYRRTQHLRRANRSTFLGGRFGRPNLCLPQQSLNICPRHSWCSRSSQHCRRTCQQRKYRSQRSVRSHRWRSLAGKKYKSRGLSRTSCRPGTCTPPSPRRTSSCRRSRSDRLSQARRW